MPSPNHLPSNSILRFFIRNHNDRLKHRRDRVISHERLLCKHTFPSGLTATNNRATPPAHPTITPRSPLATSCNFSNFPLPLFVFFSRIHRRSLSTSKFSITLDIDILYWFLLSSRLLAQSPRIYAAPISEICALGSIASK